MNNVLFNDKIGFKNFIYRIKNYMENFYIYIYLDPRKQGNYNYSEFNFDYEPFYVGKGSGYRYLRHLTDKSRNSHKINRIKNIIQEGYTPIIIKLFENLEESESYKKEFEIIQKIGRRIDKTGPLTNYLKGGTGYILNHTNKEETILKRIKNKHSEETKEKIRKSHRTEEYKNKMSIKMIGIVNITDDIKNKISNKLKSKKMKRSDETKKKISDKNKNRIHTEKSRKNMSLSHIGLSMPRFKYILISPSNNKFEFSTKENLINFINQNNMSIRLILKFLNKGKIIIKRHSEKTINTENWEIKRENYEKI